MPAEVWNVRWMWILILGSLLGCAEEEPVHSEGAELEFPGGKTDSLFEALSDPSYLPLSCSEPTSGHDPNGIHNQGDGPHFEGWYYRATDPSSDTSWVLMLPIGMTKGQTRAFVELIEGPGGTTYKRVLEDVDLTKLRMEQGNSPSNCSRCPPTRSAGDSSRRQADHHLDFTVDACAYWGNPFTADDRWTMGWVTETPGVPLRWHVHHFKGEASGVVGIDGEERLLNGYSLHQEKNWGGAFPSSWVWFQVNEFDDRPDVAFAAAGGPIFSFPWAPEGYMAGLRWKDQFFNWRTQDGNLFPVVEFRVEPESEEAVWRLVAESWAHRMEVRVRVPVKELIPIDVPTPAGLKVGAVEHLAANLEIDLFERSGLAWVWVDTMTTGKAAVEAGGTLARDAGLIP